MPAGWGTDHRGQGRCKLHGGVGKRRGAANPNFKHGLYAQHLSEEEKVDFEEFAGRFELAKVSMDELFSYYRLLKVLSNPGPIPPALLAKVLRDIAGWKKTHHEMLHGKTIEIAFTQREIQALVDAVPMVLAKYVPEQYRKEALDELFRTAELRNRPSQG